MVWLQANWGYLATVLWVACELLNQMSTVKSNSVIELVINSIEALIKGQTKGPPA